MKFEPSKFYIGLIDFFSILLPGALLTYLIKDWGYCRFFGGDFSKLDPNEQALLFLFFSYLLGHFIFLIGAAIMDKHVYDPIRPGIYDTRIKAYAKGKPYRIKPIRWVARQVFKSNADEALAKALAIKANDLEPLGAEKAVNAYKWSRTRLYEESPAGLADVQRFEANSKFFRSLMVVLIILFVISIPTRVWYVPVILFGLLLLSTWRYMDQRAKGVQQAYWFLIALEAAKPDGYRSEASHTKPIPTHAGGVIYCENENGEREYLMIQSSAASSEWVFPKGHIEGNESPAQAAVREVYEEAGVWAQVMERLGKPQSIEINQRKIWVQYYLMKLKKAHKSPEDRETKWASKSECLETLTFEDARNVLEWVAD